MTANARHDQAAAACTEVEARIRHVLAEGTGVRVDPLRGFSATVVSSVPHRIPCEHLAAGGPQPAVAVAWNNRLTCVACMDERPPGGRCDRCHQAARGTLALAALDAISILWRCCEGCLVYEPVVVRG